MWRRFQNKKKIKRSTIKNHTERSMILRQFFVGIVLICTIGIVITTIWYVTRIESLQIEEVEVVGGNTISHDEVKEKVFSELNGNYLKLIPKTFTFLYPKNSILNQLSTIPRIKEIHIKKESSQKLIVTFDEYQPYALWCADKNDVTCLFLDKEGFAFSQAPKLSGSAFVRYIKQNVNPEVKTQAFDKNFTQETYKFSQKLAEELDLYVIFIEKVDNFDILYTVSGGGVLKVSQMIPAEKSFRNLRHVLGSEDFYHLQDGTFEYIDLRFGDKIFLKEEEETASSSESSSESEL